MLDTVVGFVADNWMIASGLFGVALLAYWLFDERDEAESPGDLVERVGERAETVTAGLLDATGSLLVVLASIAIAIGNELAVTFASMNEMLGHIPFVVGHFLFGVLTFAGIEGYIPLTRVHLGLAFTVLTIIALMLRFGPDGDMEGSDA